MKILKINILLLVLLSLSNCQGFYVPDEHLYIWESTKDKDIFFASSSFDKKFDPTSRSLTQ